jgi:DNA-binding NarL/FixJ family response regulator
MADAKSILLIEDNDIVRRYYADRLRQLLTDCVIFEAATGRTGLDLFQWQTIDCVILDLSLPDMSGFEVLAKLLPSAVKLVPVLILTSFDNEALLEAAEQQGAFIALTKDLTSGDELATHVRRAMTAIPVEKKGTAAAPSKMSVSA